MKALVISNWLGEVCKLAGSNAAQENKICCFVATVIELSVRICLN